MGLTVATGGGRPPPGRPPDGRGWHHGQHDRTTAPPDPGLSRPAGARRLLLRTARPAHHLPQRRLRRGGGKRHDIGPGFPARARPPAAGLAGPGPAAADALRRDGGRRGRIRPPRAGPRREEAQGPGRLRRPGRSSVLPDPAACLGSADPADLYPIGLGGCVRHLRKTQQFFADADAGRLPAVSIVDPDFETYSEENPQDITKGESFAAEVINRVMSGPAWSHTLLIWLYDEHG